jgi:hypothetical protein
LSILTFFWRSRRTENFSHIVGINRVFPQSVRSMRTHDIHIRNVTIRLPRSAAGFARQIAGGIGNDILRSVVEVTQGRRGAMRVEELSAGKIAASSGASPERLQQQIASRVAAELRKRFG